MDENNPPHLPGSVNARSLLASIVETSSDAIISKDLNGTITSWNRAAERIFGYKAEEVIGGPISVIIPPDRGHEEVNILRRLSRGERIDHFESVRVRKDGRPIWVSLTISPLFQDGRVIGASKIARDISDQKRAKLEIEEERARLEVTLNSIGDAVVVTDVRGRILFMNPVAEKLTGWKAADAVGLPLETAFNIVNETTRRRVENPVVRSLQEGTIVGLANHTLLLSRSGTEYCIDDSAAPIHNRAKEVLGCVLVFRDVSAARAADNHRARLAAIVQSSDDAIIGKDLTGRITSWNAAAARLFGYSAEEAIGRSVSMLIPPDRLSEESDILARLRRGERVDHFETIRITRDRREVNVSLTISPIHDLEGNVIGASKIARDITDRKIAERELMEARAQLKTHSEKLEHTVAERTAELREVVAQLESFSYSVSHDLRAPLRAIRNLVELVLNEYGRDLRAEGRELLERVPASADRLGALIEEVLSTSRAKMTANLQPVDLASLVPDIIDEYPNLWEYRSAIQIHQPLLPVIGNGALLTQCISNLVGNAVKFRAPARPLSIGVRTERHGGKVKLFVQDNGIGIPAEHQPRIFELFSRGPASEDVDGSGIGLAVVKRAVTRMGGKIGLDSTPEVGSEFWIELPAVDEAG